MKVVLFLCTGNSARSQMAEGLLRAREGERVRVLSAGTEPTPAVNPLAVEAMGEIGIDISGHRPTHVDELASETFDLVVTVCGSARDSCPTLPGALRVVHIGFDDPAAVAGSPEERLACFRRVRDEIDGSLPEILSYLD